MRTTDKLKLAWPALLKLAEKGSVTIFYRGITEQGIKLYELRSGPTDNGNPTIVSGGKLLETLAKEDGENERR